jgi:hypothetical protein
MEVVLIKNKHVALLTIMLTAILSFSITSQVIVRAEVIQDFSFSSNLVAGAELSWKLTKFEKKPADIGDEYAFRITASKNMSEGDVFKIVLEEDLNTLELDYFSELYYTHLEWGEFFLNGLSLGKDPFDIFWFGPDTSVGVVITAPIIPTTVEVASGTKSYFDYMEEEFAAFSENETEGITLKNTASKFSMKMEVHASMTIFFNMKLDYVLEVVYNKDWGVLSKYELHEKVTVAGDTEEVEILYETESSDIKVPYNWTFGFVALFVTGVVVLVRRKKK